MKSIIVAGVIGTAGLVSALPPLKRDVDTRFAYTGPAIPVGDWADQTVQGNGKGFPRLVEAPAVKPSSSKPSNNINVISVAYAAAGGVNIHYQTPFGLDGSPSVHWGTSKGNLNKVAKGSTST